MVNRKLDNAELGRKTIDEYRSADKLPLVVVLDNVRSLNNVGSVFRTADALLIESICLCGFTGTPPHKEIHKTALGAELSVPWQHYASTTEAIASLRAQGYTIASVEQAEHSMSLCDFMPQKEQRYAFVFGNELHGVEQDVVNQSDMCIEIPQFGTKHSFNIAVSAGIVLWDCFVKLQAQ